MFAGYERYPVATFTWTNKSTANGITPSTDTIIDLTDADDFVIQVDTSHTSNTCTSCDVGALFCLNGDAAPASQVWDTVVTNLGVTAFGDGQKRTFVVTGYDGCWMKLRLDVNNNTGYVTVRLRKRAKRS